MNPNNTRFSVIKIAIIGAIPVILITSAVTVLLLIVVSSKTKLVSTTKPGSSFNAKNIISDYSKLGAIPSLSVSIYGKQSGTSDSIIYKLPAYSYSVSVESTDFVGFYLADKSEPDDTTLVVDQTNSFMKIHSLENDDFSPTKTTDISYSMYSGSGVICRLSSSVKPANPEGYVQQHSLVCVDRAALTKEYLKTDNLLAIYKKSQKLPEFSQAIRYEKVEGNKSYSILNLTGDDRSFRLLFAAIDGKLEYLGDLSHKTGAVTNAKYSISPELRQKINDPKYGDFIVKDIH